jgi:hypothetical protein
MTIRGKDEVMTAAPAAIGQRAIFEVDPGRAAEALSLTWGDLYQDIGVEDGRRRARGRVGDGRLLTRDTPDELAARMRAGWACRSTP